MTQFIIFFYAILAILCFSLGLQIFKRDFLAKIIKKIFVSSAGLIFAFAAYISYEQFQVFKQGPLGLIILTKEGFLWFLKYARFHIWNEYLISFLGALIILTTFRYFNKKYSERFFEPEEPYFGALAIFLAGYPGWLFYIVGLLSAYLFTHLYSLFIIHNSQKRISLYYLWLPTAVFVILISKYWLQSLQIWQILKF